eukprot:scpid57569/ scgid1642/ Polyamine oxidase
MRPRILLWVVALIAQAYTGSSEETESQRTEPGPAERRHVQLVILGGGIAGLSAARKLKQHGVTDFALLEGLDHVGGRLRNGKVANVTVELGANWVHGITGNAIWRMAQECGLKGVFSDFDNVTMRWSSRDTNLYRRTLPVSPGGKHTQADNDDMPGNSNPRRVPTSHLHSHKVKREQDATLPVARCYVEEGSKTCAGDSGSDMLDRWKTLEFTEEMVKRQRMQVDDSADDYSLRAAMRMEGWVPEDHADHAIEYFNYDFEYARSPDETSFIGSSLHVYDDFDSENFFVADQRGFSTIILKTCQDTFGSACVLSSVGDEPHRRDSHAAAFDTLPGDGAGPWLMLGRNVTRVSTSCAAAKPAWNDTGTRYCVTMADGSTLTADHVIMTFPLGVLQHNIVRFDPPLPRWKLKALHRMDIGLFSKVFVAFPRRFWDNSQFLIYVSSRRRFMVPWVNIDYAVPENATKSQHILAVILTGEEASRVEEQPLAQTQSEVMEALRDMFPSEDIPEPIDIMKTDWDIHPFFHGSYSNRPVGVTDNDLHNIRAPVGRLYFAGEATSERYNGFLQGGLESGLLAAGDVLARLGLAGDMCESDQPRPHRSTEHGHEQHRHSGKGDELSAETCDCTEKSTRKPIKSAARRHAARFLGAIWPRGRSLTHNCTCAVCRSMDCAGKHSRSAIANDTCHCDSSYSEGCYVFLFLVLPCAI